MAMTSVGLKPLWIEHFLLVNVFSAFDTLEYVIIYVQLPCQKNMGEMKKEFNKIK